MSFTLEQVYEGGRRDNKSIREDLVNLDEKLSQQSLTAHKRTLDVIAENEASAKQHRADLQSELGELRKAVADLSKGQKSMLVHLERLVVVPASEGLPAGAIYEPSPLVRRLSRVFGSRPSTTRLLLAATIAAALTGSLSACAAFGAAHAHMIGVP